ncbi:MAG: hypothetical protein JJ974_06745 [Phycisphaerales bacterium]|nr:hypothetical protein [Phycisphaerales bacterium]
MQIPRYPDDPCLIITDAGLPSLILSAMLSEQQSSKDQQRSILYPAWWTSQSDMDLLVPAIDRAVDMQADLLTLGVDRDHAGYPEDSTDASNATLGVHQSRMLLDAAALAIKLGFKRVLWPIHIQESTEDAQRLSQISTAIDRSILAARLATLDAQSQGGVEVTIETPLVDLTDQQLADIAADLNVPITSCWWTDHALPQAETESARWNKESQTASMLETRPAQHTRV